MMLLRPAELPALRTSLCEYLRSPAGVRDYRMQEERGVYWRGFEHIPKEDFAESMAASWARVISKSNLVFVTDDMAELSTMAATSLPSFSILPEDIPFPDGFAYFAKPITEYVGPGRSCCGPGVHGEERVPIIAIAWSTNGQTVIVNYYGDREAMLANWPCGGKSREAAEYRAATGRLMVVDPAWVPTSNEFVVSRDDEDETMAWLSIVKSFWLLMQQPLAVEESVRIGRPGVRNGGAAKKPSRVRVIALRRPAGAKSTGESDREWKHRWMVRGHWRMQPWGPKRERVRPVWIAPHIKGPEDKPLIGGEKVYHLKR